MYYLTDLPRYLSQDEFIHRIKRVHSSVTVQCFTDRTKVCLEPLGYPVTSLAIISEEQSDKFLIDTYYEVFPPRIEQPIMLLLTELITAYAYTPLQYRER